MFFNVFYLQINVFNIYGLIMYLYHRHNQWRFYMGSGSAIASPDPMQNPQFLALRPQFGTMRQRCHCE